ncbi:hypothetical protein [Streptomyces sp. NRRL F-5630]|uniref:hypothetical protein n=1 Tax=Streptomyces sp. NRRL F-5630 TaxID=1463864 RepID=UPI003D714C74
MRGRRMKIAALAAVMALAAGACGGEGKKEGEPVASSGEPLPLIISASPTTGAEQTSIMVRLRGQIQGAPGRTSFDVTLTPGKQPEGAAEAWKLAVTDEFGEHAQEVRTRPGSTAGQLKATVVRELTDLPARFLLRLDTPPGRVIGQSVRLGLVARTGKKVIGRSARTIAYPAVEVVEPSAPKPLGKAGAWSEYAFTVRNLTKEPLDGYSADLNLSCEVDLEDAPCAAKGTTRARAWEAVQWRGPEGWADVSPEDGGEQHGADRTTGLSGRLDVRELALPPNGSREIRVRIKPGAGLVRDKRTVKIWLGLTKPHSAEPKEPSSAELRLP